jgi:hypothetical protein
VQSRMDNPETVTTRVHPPDFGGVRVANYFYFSVFLYFVFHRPVSCIPNVASVSGLSIHFLD